MENHDRGTFTLPDHSGQLSDEIIVRWKSFEHPAFLVRALKNRASLVIEAANRPALEAIDLSPGKLVGGSPYQLLERSHYRSFAKMCKRVVSSGQTQGGLLRCRQSTGERDYCFVNVAPVAEGYFLVDYESISLYDLKIRSTIYLDRLFQTGQKIVMLIGEHGEIFYVNNKGREFIDLLQTQKGSLSGAATPYDVIIKNRLANGQFDFYQGKKIFQFYYTYDSEVGLTYIEGFDITQQREQENLLKLQGEIIKNMSEGVALVRTDTNQIIYANPNFEKLFEYEPGEMIGMDTARLNAPSDFTPEEVSRMVREVLYRDGEWHGEVVNIKKNGTAFWVDYNITYFEHPGYGEVWVGTATDITLRKKQQQSLELSEARLGEAQKLAKLGSWNLSIESNIMTWSAQVYRIFGMEPGLEEIAYQFFLELIHPEDRKRFLDAMSEILENSHSFDIQHRIALHDGTKKVVRHRGELVLNKKGVPVSVSGTIQDITDDRARVKESMLLGQVFRNAAEAVVVTNEYNKIIQVNPAFENITGFTEKEAIGKDPGFLKSGRHSKEFYIKMWKVITEEGYWEGEIWDRRKNGEVYPKYLTITAMVDEISGKTNYVGIFSDITQKKKAEEELKYLAYYDALTGLPNRYQFMERLDEAIRVCDLQKKQIALFFLDLDNFKQVNDTMGHSAGDELLRQTATTLQSTIRESDLIARLGGDEFAIALVDIKSRGNAEYVAKEILKNISRPYSIFGETIYIYTSIGISMFPEDHTVLAEILKKGDTAMYHTKATGKSSYSFYHKKMEEAIEKRQFLDVSMHKALANKEFDLVYQPQVDVLQHGKIVGLEALIRWIHPEKGYISPVEFIPFAEESGLIVSIGEYVLKEACRQCKKWQDEGLPSIPISVNFSIRQFEKINVPGLVGEVLKETGLEPRYLKVEITEGHLMDEVSRMIEILTELENMGVRSSIDDFGTGYSSLNYLHQFPIYELKIDKSFVRDIERDQNIAKAVISLAEGMGVEVIAEGVESKLQVDTLLMLGCSVLQGYYYSRPLRTGEMGALLKKGMINDPSAT